MISTSDKISNRTRLTAWSGQTGNSPFFLLFVLTVTIVIAGCNNEPSLPLEEGAYTGTYTVTYNARTPDAYARSGPTTLTLSEGEYTITENTYITPPQSGGTYVTDNYSISFRDRIIHTADFDWTLIPDSTYRYTYDGATLSLKQYDEKHNRIYSYSLTKQ